MNIVRSCSCVMRKLSWLVVAAVLANSAIHAKSEETFPVLRTKTTTYTNVTVTTKNKSYIFILHSAGMNSIKISDLPDDIQQQLGYRVVSNATTAAVAAADSTGPSAPSDTPKESKPNRLAVFFHELAEKFKSAKGNWKGQLAEQQSNLPPDLQNNLQTQNPAAAFVGL